MKTKHILFLCAFAFMLFFCNTVHGAGLTEYDGYIVKYKTPIAIAASDSYDDSNALTPLVPEQNIFLLKNETPDFILTLASDSNVEYIEPDYTVRIPDDELVFEPDSNTASLQIANAFSLTPTFSEPNDPFYAKQWGTAMVNADAVWENGAYSSDIKIAVIDSGSASLHPDITQNIVTEVDYTGTSVYDVYKHSTFITGTIAADTNNNLGIAGILPEASIVSLKVFKEDTGSISNIAKAIYDAVDVYDCDVLNLSLGADVNYVTLSEAIEYAVRKNTIVVAAAGNKAVGQTGEEIMYPAGNDGVIGVGSVTSDKEWYSNSHYNSSVDVCAPGVIVYSALLSVSSDKIRYTYGTGTGTSYAAPYVTAAAAVAKYYDPSIDSDGFMELLANTCEHLGDPGKNAKYGYGLINLREIVDYYNKLLKFARFNVEINDDTANVSLLLINRPLKDGTVYVCSYGDDDTLIDSKAITAGSSSLQSIDDIALTLDTSAGQPYIKVFFWDENMKPIIEPYIYQVSL